MSLSSFHWALLLLLSLQTACSDVSSSGPPVTVRDSDGVRIVESARPLWAPGEAWRVDPEPALEIGADPVDATQSLFGAVDVERLRDGRLVISNRGSYRLLVFTKDGGFVEAVGRRGEGPGEFDLPGVIHRCGGDTLVVEDRLRIHLFDPRLRFLRTERVSYHAEDSYPGVEGVSLNCSAVLIRTGRTPAAPRGQVEESLYWETPESGRRDTVARLPGQEYVTLDYRGETWTLSLPWGWETVWTMARDTFYLGRSDGAEIRVLGPRGGLQRVIRWTAFQCRT